MGQWVRVCTILAEEPSKTPRTQPPVTLAPSDALFWPPRVPALTCTYSHSDNTHIIRNIINYIYILYKC